MGFPLVKWKREVVTLLRWELANCRVARACWSYDLLRQDGVENGEPVVELGPGGRAGV